MALNRARCCAGWLLLSVWGWTACRQVSVCDDARDCSTPSSASTEGGMGGQPDTTHSGGAGAGSAPIPPEMAGVGGQPVTVEGGAGAGGETEPTASCRPGTAECDGSTFTVCETPLTFSFRNCGGCGLRCEGSCISGHCKAAELIFDRGAQSFVANDARGFALVSGTDQDAIYRIDLDSGATELIAEGLDSSAELLLGAERLYVAYDDRVLRMAFDGSGLVTETFEPESFGATKDGAYYTSSEYDPAVEPNEQWSLWFRANAASKFQRLKRGLEYTIVGSSRESLLVEQRSDDTAEMLLVQGAEITSLGPAPEEARAVQALVNGGAFLVGSADAPSGHELLWLTKGEEPKHFAVEPALDQYEMAPAPLGVALLLTERRNTFVRLYTDSGPEQVPFGINNFSSLAYVDAHYFWYNWYAADDGLPRFQRARQFELSDGLPE